MLNLTNTAMWVGKNYIDGKWQPALSGKTFDVVDPGSEQSIGTCPESSTEDANHAIRAAANAFPSWRARPGRERGRVLRRWYDLVIKNADDLATIISAENGKAQADAKGEVQFAASFLEWFAEEASRVYGDIIPHSQPGFRVSVIKEPVGVCGLIVPWNFPAGMVTRKVGAALAAGCTVVVKTAGETPFTANAIMSLGELAGVPKGVVNIVCALDNTPEVGLAFCTSPIVRKVSFTGSTRVGRLLMKQCSDTVKKLSLELGGNAPVLVFNDADLDLALQNVIASKFKVSGQTCVVANRIFVHESIADAFIERLVEVVSKFRLGRAADSATTHGPLIHSTAASRVEGLVEDAVSKGAKVAIGGRRRCDLGSAFFEPTVLTGVTNKMEICHQEIFGPIAPVYRFKTEEEAIDAANDSEVGLAAYVYTQDVGRAARVTESLHYGMVALNTGAMADASAPFGGIKQSGFGREGSKYGMDDYMQTKTLVTGNVNTIYRAHI